MDKPFEVDDRIYGFCNGFFGRDSYEDKICVFVNNRYGYAVFEDFEDGYARVLNYPSKEESKEKWGDEDYFFKATQEWKITRRTE